jgi:hypothetical protein
MKQKILKVLQFGFKLYHPRFSVWYMLIIIICLSIYYNYQEILFLRPQSIHQWKQCDGLSFTLNYYQDNNPLLEPAMHFLGGDGTGKAAEEFPIIFYLVAKLWKVFGYHEYIFRLVNLIIFFLGLIALMKTFEDILKDSFLAISTPLLLFAFPVTVYYANNFIPNIPSFGFVLIAWYLFWLFYKSGKNIFLWLSLLVFTLAGLIKITAIISLIALLAVFFLEATGISKFKNGNRLFKHPYIEWIPFILAFGLIFSWYIYANYYNIYHKAYLILGIRPIWSHTIEEIYYNLQGIKEQIKWSYFHKSTYWFLFTICTLIIVTYKKANKLLLFISLLIFIAIICFFLLYFYSLFYHDYYVIDLYIFLPVVCLTLMCILKDHYPVLFRSIYFKLAIVIILAINADFAKRRINERYFTYSWMNDNYLLNIKRFENITPYLRAIGIEADDKVLCLPDQSPNITLYFLNQKGWTNYSTNMDSTRIKYKINAGADYLFIYIDSVYNNPNIKPFITKKIGEINNIDIYDISSFRTTKN